MSHQKANVSGGAHIGSQGDHRSNCLIELKTILQHNAIDEAAVRAGVPQLQGQGVIERLRRHGGIDIEQSWKTPMHRVAVPVGGGDVITRTA